MQIPLGEWSGVVPMFVEFCVAANRSLRFSVRGFGLRTFLILEDFMAEIKMNAKGQISIPKSMREKCGLLAGMPLEVNVIEGRIVIVPAIRCHRCGKALPEEFRKTCLCPDCPPTEIIKVY